jgi:hypothetical protein
MDCGPASLSLDWVRLNPRGDTVANDPFEDEGLSGLPEPRRALVMRLAKGAAFVAPAVASWDLVSSTSAAATATSNTSNSVVCVTSNSALSTAPAPGCV